jgi:serine/threonine-protein kinase
MKSTEPEKTAEPWVRVRLPRGEWHYDPNHLLGEPGGFGEVFEGRDARSQPIAVKRLRVSVGEAARRELKIADEIAGKSFAHVLEILDAGEDSEGGGYYIIMPRADRSLADELELRKLFPEAEAVDILRQIAEGLKEVGILVHRDLKPGNVLLQDGRWKIADFGIARFVEDATTTHTVRGCLSPPYAAPEQWTGEHTTNATDIYALCCLAYALLRGTPPFQGPTLADFKRQHTRETPPPLTNGDQRVRAIVAAGLRKPPAGRPPIDRLIAVLREVASNPAPTPAIAALHAINAMEVERVSEAKAEAARERREEQERNALVRTGEEVFTDLIERLEKVARENASEARIDHAGDQLWVSLGEAELEIELQGAVPPISFPSSGWQVLSIGRIGIKQSRPEWKQGATLWYMKLREAESYRWYEVAYKRHALSRAPVVGPFAIQDLGDDIYRHADLAAGPGMHAVEIEFGPALIDDENSEAFFERWLKRLADAYNGRLRPF